MEKPKPWFVHAGADGCLEDVGREESWKEVYAREAALDGDAEGTTGEQEPPKGTPRSQWSVEFRHEKARGGERAYWTAMLRGTITTDVEIRRAQGNTGWMVKGKPGIVLKTTLTDAFEYAASHLLTPSVMQKTLSEEGLQTDEVNEKARLHRELIVTQAQLNARRAKEEAVNEWLRANGLGDLGVVEALETMYTSLSEEDRQALAREGRNR